MPQPLVHTSQWWRSTRDNIDSESIALPEGDAAVSEGPGVAIPLHHSPCSDESDTVVITTWPESPVHTSQRRGEGGDGDCYRIALPETDTELRSVKVRMSQVHLPHTLQWRYGSYHYLLRIHTCRWRWGLMKVTMTVNESLCQKLGRRSADHYEPFSTRLSKGDFHRSRDSSQ